MLPASYQLTLSFEQVLALVKQLPYPQKMQLSQELAKEVLDDKLTNLLGVFKTEELSLETINQEVDLVRAELHARKTAP